MGVIKREGERGMDREVKEGSGSHTKLEYKT